ncbi:MAG TPA: PqiC family protein [Stellaceae bacterium]|nr:PqiC family protein [Stellaceae bacterium]
MLLGLLGAAAAVLGACSASPDPVLYTIAPVNGATRPGGPKVVVIERVQIANYLDRSQIVRSSEDYRVDLKSNDWWGEALGSMLRRILQQELAQRLPQSSVLSETGAVNASPDATIDIDFQRLDEDRSGNVVLQAQVSVSLKGRKGQVLRNFHITGPVPSPDVKGEVTAISTAVGQLADALAALLVAGR